jgi:hypothetical protein
VLGEDGEEGGQAPGAQVPLGALFLQVNKCVALKLCDFGERKVPLLFGVLGGGVQVGSCDQTWGGFLLCQCLSYLRGEGHRSPQWSGKWQAR